jgi:hypothetical protein
MIDPLDQLNNPTALTLEAPITQYLRPDGRKRQNYLAVAGDAALEASKLLALGFRFEAEVLGTDEVSLTVHDPDTGEDIGIEICPNGPEVPLAFARLVHTVSCHFPRLCNQTPT